LLEKIRTELSEAKVEYTRVGMLRSGIRTSLPMQPAEQIPIPDLFWEQLFTVAAAYNPKTEAAFLNLYLQKTPEEINAIRLANQVACTGIRAFHESLAPGATEVEISAVIEAAIQKETGKGSVFYSRGWAMIQSGPNTADSGRFNRSTGRRLESGDLVLLELGTCVNGYWSDLTRTAAVGTASSKLEEILGVVGKAQGAAVAAVRPGIPAGEIDSTARNIIERHGFSRYFTHATGHHVGFRYHDPGFGISPGETQQLLPGMIITVEPGIYVKEFGGGARLEDNILVTEAGHEVLSQETPNLAAA
jgi:Xaa-Pro aminopeptidase